MGVSRAKSEDCGISCQADKVVTAVKNVFTAKPEAYDKHDEKEPTTEQVRRLRNKSIDAIENDPDLK